MEDVEKIYCCGRDNGYGMNDWMNNPFAYLMFLALFRNGGFGFGGDAANVQGAETQAQLNAIRTQLQDNQNADCIKEAIAGNAAAISQLANNLNIDFNTLQNCCCQMQAAIQEVGGKVGLSSERVINAVNLGNTSIIAAIKDCCCNTQQAVMKMGYENQLGQKDIINTMQSGFDRTNTGLERGFAQVGYQAAQDKCDIIAAGTANTQRIVDTLNAHWKEEDSRKIQSLEFQLSQKDQNEKIAQMIAQAKGCGCNGCGNGCGY